MKRISLYSAVFGISLIVVFMLLFSIYVPSTSACGATVVPKGYMSPTPLQMNDAAATGTAFESRITMQAAIVVEGEPLLSKVSYIENGYDVDIVVLRYLKGSGPAVIKAYYSLVCTNQLSSPKGIFFLYPSKYEDGRPMLEIGYSANLFYSGAATNSFYSEAAYERLLASIQRAAQQTPIVMPTPTLTLPQKAIEISQETIDHPPQLTFWRVVIAGIFGFSGIWLYRNRKDLRW